MLEGQDPSPLAAIALASTLRLGGHASATPIAALVAYPPGADQGSLARSLSATELRNAGVRTALMREVRPLAGQPALPEASFHPWLYP
jgi:hypothetical protein